MDEPDGGCSWQAWKFGMKREDLYTKLQDQYNTVTLSIQDPDAFHHDVCEISKTAVDLDEFHRMLQQRRQLRLDQLNESLQSASVEIIANPKLIGTEQWQHAVQLFRTRSFDSLVRYFSSYLPEDHQWNTYPQSPTSQTFYDEEDGPAPFLTHEPLSFVGAASASLIPASHLPPSPRSLTMCSDSSSASTPARTLSFSEQGSDVMLLSTTLDGENDYETSQWDDPDTPTTPMSEISDMNALPFSTDDKHNKSISVCEPIDLSASLSPTSVEDNAQELETETPKPHEVVTDSYLSQEVLTILRPETTPSPLKYTPLERRFREASPGLSRSRRKSPELGRIQKSSPDPIRARPRSCKR
ncbi:hypothetical protein F4777DRAFT_209785 [Nemania sp. FL0916]|nr:hypothetical protein F4777DRAFT_209785 [Nemania sp. FL0916]